MITLCNHRPGKSKQITFSVRFLLDTQPGTVQTPFWLAMNGRPTRVASSIHSRGFLMEKQLLVTAGPDKGRVFSLPEGSKLVLGRGRRTDTRLTDLHVSRVHCEVEVKRKGVRVPDLDSGTFVRKHWKGVLSLCVGSARASCESIPVPLSYARRIRDQWPRTNVKGPWTILSFLSAWT